MIVGVVCRPVSLVLILVTATLIACLSHTSFQPWSGPGEFVGDGGAYTTKDGIDVYTAGSPPRRFRVLGVIDSSVLSSGPAVAIGGNWWAVSRMVSEAKEQGGDAIVMVEAGA